MSFISQIVYPEGLIHLKNSAYLIGWNLEGFRCSIVCHVPTNVISFDELNLVLSKAMCSVSKTFISCSKSGRMVPSVIGLWIPSNIDPSSNFDTQQFAIQKQLNIWITMTVLENQNVPCLLSLYSLGSAYNSSCHMIKYPLKKSYALDIFMDDYLSSQISSSLHTSLDSLHHDLSEFDSDITSASGLRYLIAQLNCSTELQSAIDYARKSYYINRPSQYSVFTLSHFFRNFYRVIHHLSVSIILPILLLFAWFILICTYYIRCLVEQKMNLSFGSLPAWAYLLFPSSSSSSSSVSSSWLNFRITGVSLLLSNVSFAFQHFLIRSKVLQQLYHQSAWFALSQSIGQSASSRKHVWYAVNNTMLQIILDCILGCIVGSYLLHHERQWLQTFAASSKFVEQSIILDSLIWFTKSPGGIKLSPLITSRIGAVIRYLVLHIHFLFTLLWPKFILWLIRVVALMGCLGFIAQLYMILDILSLLTLHLNILLQIFAFQQKHHIQLVRSLWLLFYGRKLNILRGRVDTCTYDRSQLLFGTLLFAIATFLLPTCMVYYLLFAVIHVCLLCVKTTLWGICQGLLHLPLYTLLLSSFSYQRVTRGIQLRLESYSSFQHSDLVDRSYSDSLQKDETKLSGITNNNSDKYNNNNLSIKHESSSSHIKHHKKDQNVLKHPVIHTHRTPQKSRFSINQKVDGRDNQLIREGKTGFRLGLGLKRSFSSRSWGHGLNSLSLTTVPEEDDDENENEGDDSGSDGDADYGRNKDTSKDNDSNNNNDEREEEYKLLLLTRNRSTSEPELHRSAIASSRTPMFDLWNNTTTDKDISISRGKHYDLLPKGDSSNSSNLTKISKEKNGISSVIHLLRSRDIRSIQAHSSTNNNGQVDISNGRTPPQFKLLRNMNNNTDFPTSALKLEDVLFTKIKQLANSYYPIFHYFIGRRDVYSKFIQTLMIGNPSIHFLLLQATNDLKPNMILLRNDDEMYQSDFKFKSEIPNDIEFNDIVGKIEPDESSQIARRIISSFNSSKYYDSLVFVYRWHVNSLKLDWETIPSHIKFHIILSKRLQLRIFLTFAIVFILISTEIILFTQYLFDSN